MHILIQFSLLPASRLETLRKAAASEFQLRGPFPFEANGRIMASTNRLLAAFYAMSLVTQRRGRLTEGERALLRCTADERAQLCDRICHVFQVLASSVMLEYPLTDALPSVASTRDRLLAKIHGFRKEHGRGSGGGFGEERRSTESNGEGPSTGAAGGDGGGVAGGKAALEAAVAERHGDPPVVVEERDYALLYAYALVTGQVAEELKVVAKEIEGLFGVLREDSLLLQ